MPLKIDIDDLLPELDQRLERVVTKVITDHELRKGYKRQTGTESGFRRGYLSRKEAAEYIGVTPETFDRTVRPHVQPVRGMGHDRYSIAKFDESLAGGVK